MEHSQRYWSTHRFSFHRWFSSPQHTPLIPTLHPLLEQNSEDTHSSSCWESGTIQSSQRKIYDCKCYFGTTSLLHLKMRYSFEINKLHQKSRRFANPTTKTAFHACFVSVFQFPSVWAGGANWIPHFPQIKAANVRCHFDSSGAQKEISLNQQSKKFRLHRFGEISSVGRTDTLTFAAFICELFPNQELPSLRSASIRLLLMRILFAESGKYRYPCPRSSPMAGSGGHPIGKPLLQQGFSKCLTAWFVDQLLCLPAASCGHPYRR